MRRFSIFIYLILSIVLISPNWTHGQCVELNSGVSTPLTSVSASSSTVYYTWVCGNGGVVLKTSNNGTTWLIAGGNGLPQNISLINIHVFPWNSVLVLTTGMIGDTTFVYRTSNGGMNWNLVFRQNGGKINGVVSNQYSSLMFMVGDPVNGRWSIWKSTNLGINWDSTGMYLAQNGNEKSWNNSVNYYKAIFVGNDNTLSFGTNNSRIYFSTNDGLNWVFRQTDGEQEPFKALFYEGFSPYGIYTGGSSQILWSSNSGINWISDPNPPGSGRINGLISHSPPVSENSIGNNLVYITRNDSKIYIQLPYSLQWEQYYSAPSGNYTHMDINMMQIWAVRDNGGITLCTIPGSIGPIGNIIPVSYSLSQNYPNPFNPTTKIKFQIAKLSAVKLIVYDILGREVANLISPVRGGNEGFTPGTYEAEWDASNYSSGVYFYKLVTAGYTDTKKMVLIK